MPSVLLQKVSGGNLCLCRMPDTVDDVDSLSGVSCVRVGGNWYRVQHSAADVQKMLSVFDGPRIVAKLDEYND